LLSLEVVLEVGTEVVVLVRVVIARHLVILLPHKVTLSQSVLEVQ
jgi:hypothetical protein